jgi:hypothetical protein
MTIEQWKKRFVRIVYQKYEREPPQKRLPRFLDNVRDAEKAVLREKGRIRLASIPKEQRKRFLDHKLRIAPVFPDLFLLCDLYGMDLEYGFGRLLEWFKKQKDRETKSGRQ